MVPEPLLHLGFAATLIEWRGPAPFVFAPVPDQDSGEIRWAAQQASYGWGCVPVHARIGDTRFTTSLFPRDGKYLLPIKVAVQRRSGVAVGDQIQAEMQI